MYNEIAEALNEAADVLESLNESDRMARERKKKYEEAIKEENIMRRRNEMRGGYEDKINNAVNNKNKYKPVVDSRGGVSYRDTEYDSRNDASPIVVFTRKEDYKGRDGERYDEFIEARMKEDSLKKVGITKYGDVYGYRRDGHRVKLDANNSDTGKWVINTSSDTSDFIKGLKKSNDMNDRINKRTAKY